MEIYPGISMDPDVRFGKPCLAGNPERYPLVGSALPGRVGGLGPSRSGQLNANRALPGNRRRTV